MTRAPRATISTDRRAGTDPADLGHRRTFAVAVRVWSGTIVPHGTSDTGAASVKWNETKREERTWQQCSL
jgi:hypothetical protein